MALTFGGKRRPGGTGPRTPLDPLEQQMTDRLAAVMRALAASTDVDAYVRAIRSLDPDLVERLLAEVSLGSLGDRIGETLGNVVSAQGAEAVQQVIRATPDASPTPASMLEYPGVKTPSGAIVPADLLPADFEFVIANPRQDMFTFVDQRATDYATTRSASLVREIDQSNRLAIRRVISRAFTDPTGVEGTARSLRQIVGLHSRWADAVIKFDDQNYRRFIKDGMSTDAARAKADTLTKRYRDKLIRRRAEMIARTEIQQAQNFGRQAAWTAGNKSGHVDGASLKEWQTAPSGSRYGPPCPICAEMKGKRVAWNGEFPNGQMMPPAHPHCRCTAVLVPPSRGLQGQPSQDLASWLDRLDQMEGQP